MNAIAERNEAATAVEQVLIEGDSGSVLKGETMRDFRIVQQERVTGPAMPLIVDFGEVVAIESGSRSHCEITLKNGARFSDVLIDSIRSACESSRWVAFGLPVMNAFAAAMPLQPVQILSGIDAFDSATPAASDDYGPDDTVVVGPPTFQPADGGEF